MKVYGIIESYQDYRTSDATNWGVERTIKDARKRLEEIVGEILEYKREEMSDTEWHEFVENHYTNKTKTWWMYDNGDVVFKFYIDELDF